MRGWFRPLSWRLRSAGCRGFGSLASFGPVYRSINGRPINGVLISLRSRWTIAPRRLYSFRSFRSFWPVRALGRCSVVDRGRSRGHTYRPALSRRRFIRVWNRRDFLSRKGLDWACRSLIGIIASFASAIYFITSVFRHAHRTRGSRNSARRPSFSRPFNYTWSRVFHGNLRPWIATIKYS